MLLFANDPRRDVKPLAKALLDRFGGFADVISAEPDALRDAGLRRRRRSPMLKAVREAALRLVARNCASAPVDRLVGQADRLLQRRISPTARSRSSTSCSSTARTG